MAIDLESESFGLRGELLEFLGDDQLQHVGVAIVSDDSFFARSTRGVQTGPVRDALQVRNILKSVLHNALVREGVEAVVSDLGVTSSAEQQLIRSMNALGVHEYGPSQCENVRKNLVVGRRGPVRTGCLRSLGDCRTDTGAGLVFQEAINLGGNVTEGDQLIKTSLNQTAGRRRLFSADIDLRHRSRTKILDAVLVRGANANHVAEEGFALDLCARKVRSVVVNQLGNALGVELVVTVSLGALANFVVHRNERAGLERRVLDVEGLGENVEQLLRKQRGLAYVLTESHLGNGASERRIHIKTKHYGALRGMSSSTRTRVEVLLEPEYLARAPVTSEPAVAEEVASVKVPLLVATVEE